MRILLLSQYYDPEPLLRPVELAEELTRRGHEVAVLTGLPNYPTGILAPGYGLVPFRRETIRGIPVLRVFELPYHGPSGLRRMLNYGSFAVSAAVAALFIRRPDAVFVCHPPLTIAVTAWVLRHLRGAPFVYDVQDIWPDAVLMTGMMREGRATRLLRWLERFAYRSASAIVVVTEGARRNLLAKGVAPEKLEVVPPWAYGGKRDGSSETEVARAREQLDGADRFVVTFAGNIGLMQGLETVVRAAVLLRDEPRIVFRIVGEGMQRRELEALAKEMGAGNVRFLGLHPPADIPAMLVASDALLVHLRAGPLTDLYLPAKTLEYLAAGRPIVVAMTGEAADLVRACDAGLVVPPEDPKALAGAVRSLFAMSPSARAEMGLRGRSCSAERFSREEIVGRIDRLLLRVAGARGKQTGVG